MTIYIVSLFACLFLGLTTKTGSNKDKRRYAVFCFGLMIIVSALRHYTVGRDLASHYYRMFSTIANLSWGQLGLTSYDVGFAGFYKIISLFTQDPQWMIVIHSILVIGVSGWFIYRNSDDVRVSTIMFIAGNTWFMYLTMLRQSLAICIILIALEVWKTNFKLVWKWVLYVLLIALATSMHSSAIVFIAAPLLLKLKFKRKEILGAIVVVVASYVLYSRLFVAVSTLIGGRRDFADFYSDSGAAINIISLYGVLINVLFFMLACYVLVYKKRNSLGKFNDGLDNPLLTNDFLLFMTLMYIVCRVTGLRANIMGRMSYYFGPFIWILFPRTLRYIPSVSNRRILRFGILVIMVIAFVWMGFRSAESLFGTVPYRVFWR